MHSGTFTTSNLTGFIVEDLLSVLKALSRNITNVRHEQMERKISFQTRGAVQRPHLIADRDRIELSCGRVIGDMALELGR